MSRRSRKGRAIGIAQKLRDLQAEIESLSEEVQQGYDNMPESLQQSKNGQRSEEAVNSLDDAAEQVEDAAVNLESAFDN